MKQVVSLGWCLAQLHTSAADARYDRLVIVSPAKTDGCHTPASSVAIMGQPNLLALRDFLNAAYPEEGCST